jgi:hypothetical protein
MILFHYFHHLSKVFSLHGRLQKFVVSENVHGVYAQAPTPASERVCAVGICISQDISITCSVCGRRQDLDQDIWKHVGLHTPVNVVAEVLDID